MNKINSDYNRPVTFVGSYGIAVTPSDVEVFDPSNIYIGGDGDLNVLFADQPDTPVLLKGLIAGMFLPILVIAVYDTDTSCTDIVRLK
jgi:hypothetical protein